MIDERIHILDCCAEHKHTYPACCSFKCWCTRILPEGLKYLEDLTENSWFICPWNGKKFKVLFSTPSATWVEVIEDVQFEVRNKKTGIIKVVKTKKTKNEPWARGTVVEPLNL